MKKNNYRDHIIQLEAQLEHAIAHLTQHDSTIDWHSQLASVAITPEQYQTKLKEFQQRARANLKPGVGRKPAKPVIINGQETTYKQEAWTQHLTKLGIDVNSTKVRGDIKSQEDLNQRLGKA